jgi:hypothetical protein
VPQYVALMTQSIPNLGLALARLFKNLIWTFYGTLWGYPKNVWEFE